MIESIHRNSTGTDASSDTYRDRLSELVDVNVLTVDTSSRPYGYRLNRSLHGCVWITDDVRLVVPPLRRATTRMLPITTPNQYLACGLDALVLSGLLVLGACFVGQIVGVPLVVLIGGFVGWGLFSLGLSTTAVGSVLTRLDQMAQ